VLERSLFYMDRALAPATHQLYLSAWKTFNTYLVMSGVKNVFEVTDSARQDVLVSFVIYCADSLKVAHTTIKTYLCGIKYFCARQGCSDPLTFVGGQGFSKLQLVLKGIKKCHITGTQPRQPITIHVLSSMINVLDKGLYGRYLDSMLKAAFLLAFFGFLRCGEFTTKSSNFDPEVNLKLSDITFQNSPQPVINLHLVTSKTDPFRKGVDIKIFPQDNHLCPLQAVSGYLQVRTPLNSCPNSPFFLLPDRVPLTRKEFTSLLRGVLQCVGNNTELIKPHSFRIGAATSAAKANIPDHLIKTLGRWSSDCYARYIRTPVSMLAQAQRDIVNITKRS
jgi:hypothetical protein